MWAIAIGLVATTIFLLEHFGRVYELAWRPSAIIKVFVHVNEQAWQLAGRILAHISGVVELAYEFFKRHFASLAETADVFLNLFVRAVEAPAYFVAGYAAVLRTYVNQTTVYVGSLVIAALIVGFLLTHKETIVELYKNAISTSQGYWAVHLVWLWVCVRIGVILASALNTLASSEAKAEAVRPVRRTTHTDIIEALEELENEPRPRPRPRRSN